MPYKKDGLAEKVNRFSKKILSEGLSALSPQKNGTIDEGYRLLFQKSPLPMWVYDRTTLKFIAVNESAVRLYNYSEEEFLAKTLLDIRPEEDVPDLLEDIRKFNENAGQPNYKGQWKHKKKDGTLLDVEVTVEKIVFNRHEAYLSVITDITAQVQTKKALEISEESYRRLFDSSPDLLYIQDGSGVFIDVNKAVLEKYGYSKNEVLGKNPEFFDAPGLNDLEKVKDCLNKAWAGVPQKFDWWSRKKNGEIFPKEVLISKGIYFGNEVIIANGRDISERKKLEKKVRLREKRYKSLVNFLSIGMIIYRGEEILFANPKAFELLGHNEKSIEKLSSRSIYHYILPQFHQQVKERTAKLLEGNATLPQTEIKVRKLSGEEIYLEVRSTLVNYKGKKAIQVILHDITGKKTAEKILKNSEERYRTLFERNMAGVYRTTTQGVWLECNEALVKAFRYSSIEEMKSFNTSELYFSREEREEYISRLREKKYLNNFRIRHKRKDGSEMWALANVSIRENEEKTEEYIEGTLIDITPLVTAQETLMTSERRFRLLAEAAIEGIVFSDEEGVIIDANDRFAQMHGYGSRDEIAGRELKDFLITGPGKARPEARKNEIKSRKKDGTVITLEAKGENIPFYGRDIRVSVFYDISERKEYERQLNHRKEEYKNLVEYSPVGIIIVNNEKVVFANNSALKLFGWEPEKVHERPSIWELIPPGQQQQVKKQIEQTYKGEKILYNETLIKNTKGEIFEVETSARIIDYSGGPALQVVVQDISYRKKLEREQLRAEVAEQTTQNLQKEIAEKIKAQRLLLETQKFTRSIIESSLDMICATDKNSRIIEFNEAAQKTFGYSFNEVKGREVKMLYASEEEHKSVSARIKERGSFSGDVLNKKKDGTTFVSYISASSLKNDAGELLGSMGISRDITLFKEAEQELRRSREQYKALFNQALIGIAQVALNGKFIQPNQKLCEILGYQREELANKKFQEITHPEDLGNSVNHQQMLINGDIDNVNAEKRYIHKSGAVIYANLSVSLVRDASGRPDYFVSVFEDITARKKAQQQSNEQTAKIKAIFDSSSHLIWTINKNFQLTSFNRHHFNRVKKIWGRELRLYENVLDTSGSEAAFENDYNTIIKQVREAFKGTPTRYEMAYKAPDGAIIWQDTHVNPIILEDGTIEELSFIAQDITEKKLAEKNIKASLLEKEVLLKEVHHRVKNNLQVISSILNLQKSYVSDEQTLNVLRESQNRIKSMAFIHESLYQAKDFSKINFSEYIINLSKNLVHSYSLSDNSVELKLNVEKVSLNLDSAIPCGLIVNELITNSLKYAFKGAKKGVIRIGVEGKNEKIALTVEDNGLGLPAKFNVKNTKTLGLQLVIALVEQINGKMELKTGKNKGTHYTIEFSV